MPVTEFFCHGQKCRKNFLIEESRGKIYIYLVHRSKNPGRKQVTLEKAISAKLHNPKRCPFCNGENIQKLKGGK